MREEGLKRKLRVISQVSGKKDAYDIQQLYEKFVKRKVLFIFISTFTLVALVFFSLSIGSASLTIKDTTYALLSHFFPNYFSADSLAKTVIWDLRLPRVLVAVVAGAAFGIAGAILQVTLRNPLASPYTLGIASSAAFGAALAIVFGAGIYAWTGEVTYTQPHIIVANAFFFSMLSTFTIFGLSKYKGASPGTMVLAGIAMMYLFSAATSLLQYFGSREQITAVVFWMFGDLGKADWLNLGVITLAFLSVLPFLLAWSGEYNVLTMSDEAAKSLGVNVESIRLISMTVSALITAVAVAFLGAIGFIGLLAPHIARMMIGGDYRFLLPTACLTGAILLLAADTASRTIVSPLMLPIGVLTAFMGVPLFLYLLMKGGKGYW